MIQTLQGKTPHIGEGTFVAPTAAVIGDVEIGNGSSVWYSAVIRGDVNRIRIGALVLSRTHIPSGELWGGVPAKFIKKITPEAAERILRRGPENYDYWTKIYLQEK